MKNVIGSFMSSKTLQCFSKPLFQNFKAKTCLNNVKLNGNLKLKMELKKKKYNKL